MKTTLWCFLTLCSFCCFSQNSRPAKDTLIWTDGTKYIGTVIGESKDGEVRFMTEDSVMHKIYSSSIAQLKRANQVQDNKLPATDLRRAPALPQTISGNVNDPINWSDPGIPARVLTKHRTGIGLTVVGTVMIVGGVAMLVAGAKANGQTTTGTNAYGGTQTNVNVGGVGAVGILSILAGIPMMIVGAVKYAKAHKMVRAARRHLK